METLGARPVPTPPTPRQQLPESVVSPSVDTADSLSHPIQHPHLCFFQCLFSSAPPPLSGAHCCLDLHIHFVNLSASFLVSGRYGLNVPTSGREYGKADCNGTQNQGLLEGERGLGRGTRGMWRRTRRGQTGTKYKTKCHRETYY